eukprot:TRINITY_DN7987_c0_g1_i1.p2 TRINITY_DN7987_c0_g1~~TRINITY_DN7987_c0_g1_i1.p2  ORF type:complete len:269 (+),score=71.89 TRINITY_DN7987_c0_g1_i1:56-808(+)
MASSLGMMRELASPIRLNPPALPRHMPGQPLQLLRDEGTHLLPTEYAVMGKDKSFQCLLLEELGRARREHDARRGYVVPDTTPPPAPAGTRAPPRALSPPSLGSPPRRVVATRDGSSQTGTGRSTVTRGTMTQTAMTMTETREEILRQQQAQLQHLRAELEALSAVVRDEPDAVCGLLNATEQDWLRRHQQKLEEERTTKRIFDTAAAINLRELSRERDREERRARRRERQRTQIELELGETARRLCESG